MEEIVKIDIKNPRKYFKELEKFSKPEVIIVKNGDKEITIKLTEGLVIQKQNYLNIFTYEIRFKYNY
ncbi:hypothetical protein [Methanocaldococcus sp.]